LAVPALRAPSLQADNDSLKQILNALLCCSDPRKE